MKNYNKILEAVNRGIKFALDDFEDQDDIQGLTNSKVNNKSHIKEYLEWNKCLDLLFNLNVNADYFDKMAKLSEMLNIHYIIEDRSKLNGIIKWVSMMCPNANLNWFDISKIDSLSYLFCSFGTNFTGDISKWDVSKVKDMRGIFAHSKFNGDISNWDVSKVENMAHMFEEALEFNGDISLWDVSNVKNMSEMFMNSKKFNGDISLWDVSGVKDMCRMFSGAVSFNSDISKWDVSNVVNMQQMFSASHFRQNISNWNISKGCNTNNMWRLSMLYDSNKPPKTRLRYRY